MADRKPSSVERKLRKLRRHPWRFFRDAAENRVRGATDLALDAAARLPVGGLVGCRRRYSVIAAVYNVEKYLDRFLESMVRQTVSFEDHIELILVDDGSPDDSAGVIARWQAKYPRSIRYVRKENGGQASARNAGLALVTGDWVTFIDPDDFVHPRYIEKVDRFLTEHEGEGEEMGLLCCKWVFYHEDTDKYVDNHPLNYRFEKGSYAVRYEPDSDLMISSAARSFFRADILARDRVYFDERLRPNFEDGHFAGTYLLGMGGLHVGFVADAVYYYRKRSDGTSTLDTGWTKPSRFGAVVELGYLALLRDARTRTGTVPRSLQKLVLYDLIWLFKKIVDNEHSVAFLTPEQRSDFQRLLFEVFDLIEPATIVDFNLAGAWFFHKVGLLGMYKGQQPPVQIVYVNGYDEAKRLVEISYFYSGDPIAERFCVEGADVVPRFAKVRVHDFLGDVFVYERRAWLQLDEGYSTLAIDLDGRPARISSGGVQHENGLSRAMIERHHSGARVSVSPNAKERALRREARSPAVRERFRDAWLVIDRDRQADDNAEHLYRHVLRNHPEINAFFVLSPASLDWSRLEREGFRLVAFGSRDHHLLLLNARHIVSSHADSYVLQVLPERAFGDLMRAKFTFLQHGVIRDDISGWLNSKKIDLFVTSSPAEHESIAGDPSRYKFGRNQVKMVGLSRHDALLERTQATEKVILIMPTWRQWLVSRPAHGTSERVMSSAFYDSSYAKSWRSLLHSEPLRQLAQRHGYRVVFFPHANMQLYASWFEAPSWVDVRTHETDPVLQLLYRRAAVMITDYSSVFFEMGLLDKPVLYYQFDYDEMYGGRHPSRVGYFDFVRDGFGPVASTEQQLLGELEAILARGCEPAPEYLRRMRATLPLRDRKNRERTVRAILDLDSPGVNDDQRAEIIVEQALAASRGGEWDLAERLWQQIVDGPTDARAAYLAAAKRELGKLAEAQELLARTGASSPEGELRLDVERARLTAARGDVPGSIERWTALRGRELRHAGLDDTDVGIEIARLRRRIGDHGRAREILEALDPSRARDLELAELALMEGNPGDALARFTRLAGVRSTDPARIGIARAYQQLGNAERALAEVSSFIRGGGPGPEAALLQAELSALVGKQSAARKMLLDMIEARQGWSREAVVQLARVCAAVGMHEASDAVLDAEQRSPDDAVVQGARLRLLAGAERWRDVVEMDRAWLAQLASGARLAAELVVVRAHRELGESELALAITERLRAEHPSSGELLASRADALSAAKRWAEALAAWTQLRREHPDHETQRARARIAFALECLGRRQEASAVLSEAARANALARIQRDPDDADAYRQLVELGSVPREVA